MALIVRIDVDRPYGSRPFFRHLLSRLGSDIYFPRVETFGYLRELNVILRMMNEIEARAYIFFRRCTLPSESAMALIEAGGHEVGLHLEDSRTFERFLQEKAILERHVGKAVLAVSKHGSGEAKYGFHHYAPYEPDTYVKWAQQSRMKLFLGNLEDPTLDPSMDESGLHVYPSAFWLEPAWRDTGRFTIDWLLARASETNIVLLLHPENVLSDPSLSGDLKRLLTSLETRVLE